MIVADTGAVYALVDSRDRHHRVLRKLFESDPDAWVLPWAILPEVDYLLGKRLGQRVEEDFLEDLAEGRFAVAWGDEHDLQEARRICRRHQALRFGLVDAVVMAVAERLKADAIATLDVRDFGTVLLKGGPKLYPRDL
jgi:predicted nucleic acid-binding protein